MTATPLVLAGPGGFAGCCLGSYPPALQGSSMTVGVPTPVDAQIEASITSASAQGLAQLGAYGHPAIEAQYAIKYTSAKFGGRYPPGPNAVSGAGLYISPSPGFTWGAALYACPVAYPISGGIYGRCGIVAELTTPHSWRLFDAADAAVARLLNGRNGSPCTSC